MVRKKFYEKYSLKIISSLAACSILYSAIPVYAYDLNDNVIVEKDNSVLSSNDQTVCNVSELSLNNNILIDSKLKEFYNLDKVRKYIGFDYKVPDYVIPGNEVHSIRVFNSDDGNNKLELEFSDKNSAKWYSIEAFRGDPVDTLTNEFKESFEDAIVSTNSKTIDGIQGLYITLTDSTKYTFAKPESCKYFAWKDGDVWYCMNYDNNEDGSIGEGEIGKISNSLKNPKEIVNVNYSIDKEANGVPKSLINIYDKDDLNKATEALGYTPKLPIKINDYIKISDSFTNIDHMGKSLFSYYSYDKGTIVFIQTKDNDNYEYEEISRTGYARENGETTTVKADKLSIDGMDVYRYADKGDNKIVYQWKEDNMYYFFEIYYYNIGIENVDDIVKEFVDFKPVN